MKTITACIGLLIFSLAASAADWTGTGSERLPRVFRLPIHFWNSVVTTNAAQNTALNAIFPFGTDLDAMNAILTRNDDNQWAIRARFDSASITSMALDVFTYISNTPAMWAIVTPLLNTGMYTYVNAATNAATLDVLGRSGLSNQNAIIFLRRDGTATMDGILRAEGSSATAGSNIYLIGGSGAAGSVGGSIYLQPGYGATTGRVEIVGNVECVSPSSIVTLAYLDTTNAAIRVGVLEKIGGTSDFVRLTMTGHFAQAWTTSHFARASSTGDYMQIGYWNNVSNNMCTNIYTLIGKMQTSGASTTAEWASASLLTQLKTELASKTNAELSGDIVVESTYGSSLTVKGAYGGSTYDEQIEMYAGYGSGVLMFYKKDADTAYMTRADGKEHVYGLYGLITGARGVSSAAKCLDVGYPTNATEATPLSYVDRSVLSVSNWASTVGSGIQASNVAQQAYITAVSNLITASASTNVTATAGTCYAEDGNVDAIYTNGTATLFVNKTTVGYFEVCITNPLVCIKDITNAMHTIYIATNHYRIYPRTAGGVGIKLKEISGYPANWTGTLQAWVMTEANIDIKRITCGRPGDF